MTARFLERWNFRGSEDGLSQSSEVTGMMYRDGFGRTREEIVERDVNKRLEIMKLVIISDPTEGTAYILQPDERLAIAVSISREGNNQGDWLFPGDTFEEIGSETVAGIQCRHIRVSIRMRGGAVKPIEIWVSDEIRSVVAEELHSPDEDYSWSLLDVQRGEPATALFQIPPEYRPIRTTK